MKFFRTFSLFLLFSAHAFGDCDCTIVPFTPPSCFQTCTAKILALANVNQLTLIFGLPAPLAQKILAVPGRATATTLELYQNALTPTEFNKLKTTFQQLQQQQLTRFHSREQ